MGGETVAQRGDNYGRRDRGTQREEIIMGGETEAQRQRRR